jgi:hypothetical protein
MLIFPMSNAHGGGAFRIPKMFEAVLFPNHSTDFDKNQEHGPKFCALDGQCTLDCVVLFVHEDTRRYSSWAPWKLLLLHCSLSVNYHESLKSHQTSGPHCTSLLQTRTRPPWPSGTLASPSSTFWTFNDILIKRLQQHTLNNILYSRQVYSRQRTLLLQSSFCVFNLPCSWGRSSDLHENVIVFELKAEIIAHLFQLYFFKTVQQQFTTTTTM